MADYLIEKYNAQKAEIADKEGKALDAALALYVKAVHDITQQANEERMDAGVALAAAMSQRDFEFHHGRDVTRPANASEPEGGGVEIERGPLDETKPSADVEIN